MKLIDFIGNRLDQIEMDENCELAIENAFMMTPKISKNIIKSMCDVTVIPYLDKEKEINFVN